MKPYFDRIFPYISWASQRVLAALQDCPAAKAEGTPLFAPFSRLNTSGSHGCRGVSRLPVWPNLTLPECQELAAQCEAGWAGYIAQLTEEKAQSQVEYRNSRGDVFVNSVADILTQVVTHGAYHRGQIAKVLGRTGGDAVNTDFIMFVRLAGAKE